MADRPSVAICTRELWPFAPGGGIGRELRATAGALAEAFAVTLVVPAEFAGAWSALVERGVLPSTVRPEFVRLPPVDAQDYHRAWSEAAYRAIVCAFPDGGPEVALFSDYQGDGCATAQARRAAAPALRRTAVVVRLATSVELCRVYDGIHDPDGPEAHVFALERAALAGADALLVPARECLAPYEDFYDALAPAVIAPRFPGAGAAPQPTDPPPPEPLRLLYAGRYQRLKGIDLLVAGARALDRGGWSLTAVGGDTPTAPGGGSMRAHVEALAAGDERIDLRGPASHREVGALMASHHVVVVPSICDMWPNVVMEALLANRPVLGGTAPSLPVMIGDAGRLVADASGEAWTATLAAMLDECDWVHATIADGVPLRRADALSDPDETIAVLRELAARSLSRA